MDGSLRCFGWLIFFNPAVKWVTTGLPLSAPHITYAPPQSSPQANFNGSHRRHDNPPVKDSYRLHHGGGTTDPLFYMDDAAFLTQSQRALITHLERLSLYLAFHHIQVNHTKTVFNPLFFRRALGSQLPAWTLRPLSNIWACTSPLMANGKNKNAAF